MLPERDLRVIFTMDREQLRGATPSAYSGGRRSGNHCARRETFCSSVRRLVYLRDTAGGGSPGFDAFRRLPPTWHRANTPTPADGLNRLNSHVVYIEAPLSRTHYHPPAAVGGGIPQTDLYFGLDAGLYNAAAA